MNTDIKLMITLAGKQRLPHLEADIFADSEVACFYLRTLCKDEEWHFSTRETPYELARNTYFCAKHIINGRWLEAERIIASHGRWACLYANNIVNGRFYLAEQLIASNPRDALWYAKYIIGGRWPNGEAAIDSDIRCQKEYGIFLDTVAERNQ